MNDQKKILLALQFWGDRKTGDWADAMRLARFIADLQPEFSETVAFQFCARFDSKPDPRTVDYVTEKFETEVFVSPRKHAVGWPYGCNELWSSVVMDLHNRRSAGELKDIECAFTFEPDCVPLRKGWADTLHKTWIATGRKTVLGAYSEVGPKKWGHINGNMVIDVDLYRRVPAVLGTAPQNAWDMAMAPAFKAAGWEPSDVIANWYRRTSVPDTEMAALLETPAVVLHGVKDDSAFNFAKKLLG